MNEEDKYYKFCLEEIKFHNDKIKEIIEEGLKNPKDYFHKSEIFWRSMIPFFLMAMKYDGSQQHHPSLEENLSEMLD